MADNTQKDPQDWVSGSDPMTGAQGSYLKTLSEQAHKPDPTKDNLTKAEASELIDEMREDAGIEK
jgi:hypothetical protein